MPDNTNEINDLSDQIHSLLTKQDRVLVAISGAPASGKSTLAEALAKRLCQQKVDAVVVPMDGFHLDNNILDSRDLEQRKGAPETFDADGFVSLIKRLKRNVEVFAPAFDRSRDVSIAGAIEVPADCQVVIVEGNYVMFNEPKWRPLAKLWDLTVKLDVPFEMLRARLIHRWLALNHTRAVATRRAESNDIPNAERMMQNALPCDVIITTDG